MSESNQFDNMNNNSDTAAENTVSDTYVTESGDDLYRTPDLTSDLQQEHSDTETAQIDNPYNSYHLNGNGAYNGQNMQDSGSYNNNPYGNSAYNGQNVQNGSPYNNNPNGNGAYNGQNMQNGSPYNNNPYGNSAYNGQNMQNGSPYNNNPYGNGAYGGQNDNSYGNSSYNGQTVQNHYQNPYGNPPYGNGNNQYSPYAMPTKKNTGLIIGIVIGIIVLFLIAIFALAYKVVGLYTSDKDKKRSIREEYNFDYDDDEWANDQNRDDYYNDGDHHYGDHYYDDYYDDYFDDYYDDYFDDYFNDGYGDYYDDYFGSGNNGDGGEHIDDDKYYSLHDEIRNDLTYSVKLEDYKYDTTYENVNIQVTYPVIEGKDVPNLEKLNSVIKDEADFITEYFEEEYQDYMMDDSDYFTALSIGYVTYMDEEKLSIAFSERMYSDYYDDVFLYCINIDMENGIVLDNESLLGIDDDFSVDFRRRSDIQNGEISYLTMMTDQEITKHFKSSDIIVFYIPQGMEIGFNYDAGWVTVTYEDYEKYLKVF